MSFGEIFHKKGQKNIRIQHTISSLLIFSFSYCQRFFKNNEIYFLGGGYHPLPSKHHRTSSERFRLKNRRIHRNEFILTRLIGTSNPSQKKSLSKALAHL